MTIEHDGLTGYEIFYEPEAERELESIPAGDFHQIDERICSLNREPRPQGVKQLSGKTYRIRSGNWRIIYLVDDPRQAVVIVNVRRRNEATYRDF